MFGMRQNVYAFVENLLVVIDFETINYKLASEFQVFDFNHEICSNFIVSNLS